MSINSWSTLTGGRQLSNFEVKDSGKRAQFESGMVRDTNDGKVQWHRLAEGPMLARWAEHLTKGAVKYPDLEDGSANWTLASGDAELRRFRESAFRHFMQWHNGDTDEDHASAVFFNVNGAEYVKNQPLKLNCLSTYTWHEAPDRRPVLVICENKYGHSGLHSAGPYTWME